jgi:outer membrane lipoprotein carrier protein
MGLAAILVLAAFVVPGGASGAGALDDALARLQARYDATRTLKAAFAQTLASPALAGTLATKGTVVFEKPNRMRWDYAAPDAQTIVGDGETLWIYQPDLKQVIKAPLRDAFQSATPVTFLAGLGNVRRDFEPSLVADETDRWVLKLMPKQQKDQAIGTLVLGVRKADASVAEATITDAAGTTTTIRFSGEERNAPVDPGTFRFSPPPGVDVVTPPAY